MAASIDTIPFNIWVLLPDYLQQYLHLEQVQILITKALQSMPLGRIKNLLKLLLLENTSKIDLARLAVMATPPTNLNDINLNAVPNIEWVCLPFQHLDDWNHAVNQFTNGIRITGFKPIPTLVDLFLKTTLNQLNDQAHCDLVQLYNECRDNH